MEYFEIEHTDAGQLKDFVYLAIHVNDQNEPPDRSILEVPQIMKYYQNWGGMNDDYGIKAVDEDTGKIVGMIWIRQFTSDDPSYGFISDEIPELTMSIDPNYRGHGIGTQLMKRLIDAVKNKYSALSLSVSLNNRAKHLYEKFGFIKYERIGDSVTMCLDLEYWSGV